MAENTITVGNVEITSVSDGMNEFPAANVFPQVPADGWARHPGFLSPEGNLRTNFGFFVVKSEGQTIMVDTGAGPERGGRLPDELKRLGVSLEDVSAVAITHLHGDHVGWNTRTEGGEIKPTFPNARYYIGKGDWDHFRKPEVLAALPYIESQVLPLERLGVLELPVEEASLTGEVTMVPTPGHTPGHMSISISSQGQNAFITGDMVNFPFQIGETDWRIQFDIDAPAARSMREAVLDRLEREKILIAAGHFMPPGYGHIIRSGTGFSWQAL